MQFFKGLFEEEPEPVIWQLRDLRFDIPSDLQFFSTEKILATSPNTNDDKGNPRAKGMLIITNFRIIWHLFGNREVNLSIGYDTISRFQKKVVFVKENTPKYLLIARCGKGGQKYEFVFSCVADSFQKVATMLIKYHQNLAENVSYRKLIIKNTFLKDGRVDLLQGETYVSNYSVKYMLSKGAGIQGILYVSNVRVVFQSNGHPQNFSLPWVCILAIKSFEDDFKKTIVIKIRHSQGFHLRGKQIDKIQTELKRMHETCKERPLLGIEEAEGIFKIEVKTEEKDKYEIEVEETKINIFKSKGGGRSYQLNQESQVHTDRIDHSEELGLAIEKLPEGMEVSDLWRLLK